jgi:hypothetical protein
MTAPASANGRVMPRVIRQATMIAMRIASAHISTMMTRKPPAMPRA